MTKKRGLANEVTYTSRINSYQKEMMIEFIEKNPQLVSNAANGTFTAAERRRLWAELANILNAEGLGATKSAEGWKDSWSEIKFYVKKKVRVWKKKMTTEKNGGRYPRANPLTPIEDRVAALIGEPNFTGLTIRTSLSEALQELQNTTKDDKTISPSELKMESSSGGQEIMIEEPSEQSESIRETDVGRQSVTSGDDRLFQRPCSSGQQSTEASEGDVMSVDLSCVDDDNNSEDDNSDDNSEAAQSDEDGYIVHPVKLEPLEQCTTTTFVSEVDTEISPSNKKRKSSLPHRVLQKKRAAANKLSASQLRSAAAMERLADSINQLVEQQKCALKMKMEMEERKIKVMADRASAEEKKFSIFQQAVSSLSTFLFKK